MVEFRAQSMLTLLLLAAAPSASGMAQATQVAVPIERHSNAHLYRTADGKVDVPLTGSYDCYIYMGSQITYTQMGFTLSPGGRYEWGHEKGGRYEGEGGRYEVNGATITFTGAMSDTVGTVKPKAGGKPSINLVPNGETWKTMYCSPR